MTTRRLVGLVLAAALLRPEVARADAQDGERLARHTCAICHTIAGSKPSPMAKATPFGRVARKTVFRKRGSRYVLERHGTMPNLALTSDDADHIAAYIRTLAR